MSTEKLNKAIRSFHSFYDSVKEKNGKSYWDTLLKKLKAIDKIAKSSEWHSMEDACHIGENLISKISSGAISNDQSSLRNLESIIKALDDLSANIKAEGQVTISVKGPLAKVKMFMDDFSDSPEGSEDGSGEDDDLSIDVMEELNKRVENLESLVLGIKESYIEAEVINAIFREFHTLKGEAGFLGFDNLGKFCHQVETILQPIREKKVFITRDIIDIMLFCVDKTKEHIKSISSKQTVSNDDANIKLAELEKLVNEIEDNATSGGAGQDEAGITGGEMNESSEFAEAFPLDDDEDTEDNKQGEAAGIPETPVEAEIKDGADSEEERDSQEVKVEKGDQPVFLNVETEKVDSLINITGELTILYQMLHQSQEIRQISDQRISNNLDMMGRFFKELQNIAISIRTVSIRPLFLKMARLARELAKKSNKKIKVSISGEAAQVDKNLINLLAGPLAHIIRNSVDHGIEASYERIENNKDEVGNIKLEARKKGNNTLIEITDDGKGISFDRLETKARESGIIPDNVVLTEKEKYELLFKPGLSTAAKVTRISGRGVGMDVIRSEVQKAKGTLEIKSQEGKGTTTSMLFSQTFAITDGLVVRINTNYFVIPIEQVKEMSQYEPDKVETIRNKTKMVFIRDHYIPLVELENFLNVKKNGSNQDSSSQIMVVVENDEKLCVLLVDEVIANQEIVVKEMVGTFEDLPFFTGTAILGNKGVGIILDIAKLTDAMHALSRKDELREVARHARDNRINVVEIGTNKVAMIDFYIKTANEILHFAVNAFKAREFIPMEMHEAIPLPKAPDGFEGIITLRGNTMPVFSLAKLLGLADAKSKPDEKIAIICEFAKKTVGFLVTGVSKVNYISWEDILPPPKTGTKISVNNVVGTILQNEEQEASDKIKKTIIFVLDFEKILHDVLPLYESLDDKITLKTARKSTNTVLLVEDSAIMRLKMKKALEAGGITVIEAENGQVALDIVESFFEKSKENEGSIFDYIDLVISDIEMPQLDGYTFTKTIKSHPELRALPVVLHSSLSNDTIIQRAKEVKADDFVSKCDPDQLLSALDKYL